jgi:hypothetical protein
MRTRALVTPICLTWLSLLTPGCLVVEHHRRPHAQAPGCHPSQYWDGAQCRHKGQGHGARKHDGEPKGKGKGPKG